MKKVFGYLMAAAGGALIGGLATKLHLEKKYRKELRTREDNLWDRYKDKLAEKTELATKDAYEELETIKNSMTDLEQLLNDERKLRKLGVPEELIPSGSMTAKQREIQLARAFVIRPDEFGTRKDYARFNYVFYPEQDEYYNSDYQTPVEEDELRDILGDVHPEDHFGEFEDEVVYIRNEDLKVDVAVFLAEEPPDDTEDE